MRKFIAMDVAAYVLVAVGGLILAFAGVHGFANKSITIISFGTGSILIIIGGCLYWQDAIWKREVQKSPGRPHLVISDSYLQVLTAGAHPSLSFFIENKSQTEEVSGFFAGVTLSFVASPERVLQYLANPIQKFRLAPGEKNHWVLPFETYSLTEEQIKALSDKTAQLYFFTKFEYSDGAGNSYVEHFCRRYEPAFSPQNLVFCDEDITFKEPEPVNQ